MFKKTITILFDNQEDYVMALSLSPAQRGEVLAYAGRALVVERANRRVSAEAQQKKTTEVANEKLDPER